jgi:hypothetical protein
MQAFPHHYTVEAKARVPAMSNCEPTDCRHCGRRRRSRSTGPVTDGRPKHFSSPLSAIA